MIGSAVVFSRISSTRVRPSRLRTSLDRRRSISATSKRCALIARARAPGCRPHAISTSSTCRRCPPGSAARWPDRRRRGPSTTASRPGGARVAGASRRERPCGPRSRRTPMVHPKPRTSRWVTASPSPMLPSLPLTNASKISVRCVGMPGPYPRPRGRCGCRRRATMPTAAPGGTAWAAFRNRFARICTSRSGSATTGEIRRHVDDHLDPPSR